MWNSEKAGRIAKAVLSAVEKSGAVYGDLRIIEETSRTTSCTDGVFKSRKSRSGGLGVRVLVENNEGRRGWGFASTSILEPGKAGKIVETAVTNGLANACFQPGETRVSEYRGSEESGEYETPVATDPFALPLSEFQDRLLEIDSTLDKAKTIARECLISCVKQDKLFCSTTGANLVQHLTTTGGMAQVTVAEKDLDHHQSRSLPCPCGNFAAKGMEFIDELDMVSGAITLYEEACMILSSPECPSMRLPVVLGPQALALLVHEVAGHALELDRALGLEAAYAGRSFLKPSMLGSFRYGDPRVNIVSDPTWPGAVSTYGWDDEGTPAKKSRLIDKGMFVGYLCGRSNAGLVGLESSAACRSTGWDRLPIDRMTNVNLLPGENKTALEIISGVERGLYLDIPCGWSINSDRNGFRFSVETARWIENGRLGAWLRNGAYRADTTPAFWSRCREIASDTPQVVGFNNCAKGQPVQIQTTGHVVPQAVLFSDVEVGQ